MDAFCIYGMDLFCGFSGIFHGLLFQLLKVSSNTSPVNPVRQMGTARTATTVTTKPKSASTTPWSMDVETLNYQRGKNAVSITTAPVSATSVTSNWTADASTSTRHQPAGLTYTPSPLLVLHRNWLREVSSGDWGNVSDAMVARTAFVSCTKMWSGGEEWYTTLHMIVIYYTWKCFVKWNLW